jgi:hypothetical protein
MKSLSLAWAGFAGLILSVAPARAQECTTDANFAAPLSCKPGSQVCSGGGAVLPDGGVLVTDPVCVSDPPTCTWSLQACSKNSECTQARWVCLPLPAAGASNVCFPEGIVCAAGQACPAGWSCVDFATVAEGDLVDMWNPNGQTKYCFPDALRGVADKTTRVDSNGVNPGNLGGGTEGTKNSSSGCALGGRGRDTLPWCLLAGLLTTRFFHRRGRRAW